jgi:hypothetical protein
MSSSSSSSSNSSNSSKSFIKASKDITEKALASRDIRGKILSYSMSPDDRCRSFIDDIKDCNLGKSFIDKSGNFLSCSYYCMKNCDK